MQLRDYQTAGVDTVFEYFGDKGNKLNEDGTVRQANPVIAMPTGTGKSLVIAGIIQRMLALYPTTRVLMLVHVKELILQNADKLLKVWPNAPLGICSSQLRRTDTAFPIIFAGVGSVANRIADLGWRDIVFIDECHLLSPNENTQYQKIIAGLRKLNPWLRVIGLSATPYRMGLGMITDGGIFTDVAVDQTTPDWFRWFIANEHLSPLIPKRTHVELDVSNVGISGGEFKAPDLDKAVNIEKVTRAALSEMCQFGENRQSWLVFTVGIDHAEACARILNEYGVPAAAVHSELTGQQRDERLNAHKAGRLRAITGNNIFTTGYDHPPIDLIGMLRPTLSTALWVQMLGRGTRPYKGGMLGFPHRKENCLVLDFARNRPKLGPIDEPNLPRKKGAGHGAAPVCICPHCDTYNHARAVICIACGGEIEHEPKLFTTAGSHELLSAIAEAPVIDWVDVSHMFAAPHNKIGAAPCLKVSFVAAGGLQTFIAWIFLERTGFAGKKARDWWRKFSLNADPPTSTAEALRLFETLRTPKKIQVHLNKAYPEIVDYEF